MPNLKISIPHKLGADEAKQRISRLAADSRQRFGDKVSDVQESWNGNVQTFHFRAMGFTVDGTLEALADAVTMDIKLPCAAALMKDRLESDIRRHAAELLA